MSVEFVLVHRPPNSVNRRSSDPCISTTKCPRICSGIIYTEDISQSRPNNEIPRSIFCIHKCQYSYSNGCNVSQFQRTHPRPDQPCDHKCLNQPRDYLQRLSPMFVEFKILEQTLHPRMTIVLQAPEFTSTAKTVSKTERPLATLLLNVEGATYQSFCR